jgi:dephospho-CoA kinase
VTRTAAIPLRRTTSPPPRKRERPVAVAITGGIGAGKSEALRAFERHGAAVISSDEIVHRLLAEDEAVRRALRERHGEAVFAGDGSVDRAAVARIVFSNPAELAWLEALLHPRVVAAYLSWRDDLAQLPDPPAVCVTEVPLLYEVGGETRFDAVIAITAATDVRIARHVRPMQDRERRLIDDEEKLRRADFAFVNDGSLADLDAFVADVVATLSAA